MRPGQDAAYTVSIKPRKQVQCIMHGGKVVGINQLCYMLDMIIQSKTKIKCYCYVKKMSWRHTVINNRIVWETKLMTKLKVKGELQYFSLTNKSSKLLYIL